MLKLYGLKNTPQTFDRLGMSKPVGFSRLKIRYPLQFIGEIFIKYNGKGYHKQVAELMNHEYMHLILFEVTRSIMAVYGYDCIGDLMGSLW